jgi:DNA-binding LytR/AlgR family response regulator
MGKISLSLPDGEFIRISRKHIVNRSYVTFYHSRDKFLKLETGDKEYRLDVTLKVHEIKDLLSFI